MIPTPKLLLAACLVYFGAAACFGSSESEEQWPGEEGKADGIGPIDSLIGGGEAQAGQLPATAGLLVAVESSEPKHLTCTMSKVGERVFLTAAHCFFRGGEQDGIAAVRPELEIGTEIGILFGLHERSDQNAIITRARVEDYSLHPTWLQAIEAVSREDGRIEASDGDAALLLVDADTPHIAVAHVHHALIEAETPVVMCGFGCTYFGWQARTDSLRLLGARIEELVGSMLYVSSGYTESEEVGGICPGDSGGGLFLASDPENLTIVGINSRFVSGQLLGAQISPNSSYFTRLDGEGPQDMESWLRQELARLAGVEPKPWTANGTLRADEEQIYTLSVPPDATGVQVQMTGTGDLDLYTRLGEPPTRRLYDCRPFSTTSREFCEHDGLEQEDSLHILVRGWAPGQFALTTTWSDNSAVHP